MTVPLAVIDTNVVVSGLLTKNEAATVCKILDGMLEASFCFLLSTDLLNEYNRVLKRPKIRTLHGLSHEEIDRVLTEIASNAIWCNPDPDADPAPDPGDNHLWALLSTRRN
ncbi:MAG: putative toxin-antitoxin system toxin component, PIN family, partial [Methylococcales bacterium]